MRSRPLPLTVAAILLVLLSLFGFPFPWLLLFPGVEQQPPPFVVYSGIVLGIVGLVVVAVGLWMMKKWSLWASIRCLCAQLPFGSAVGSHGSSRHNASHCRSAGGSGSPHHSAGSASLLPACFSNCRPISFASKVSQVSEKPLL